MKILKVCLLLLLITVFGCKADISIFMPTPSTNFLTVTNTVLNDTSKIPTSTTSSTTSTAPTTPTAPTMADTSHMSPPRPQMPEYEEVQEIPHDRIIESSSRTYYVASPSYQEHPIQNMFPPPIPSQDEKPLPTPYFDKITNKTYDYQVCDPDCTCFNNTLSCTQRFSRYYDFSYDEFNTTNIKIMKENFVVKVADFGSNNINILQKNKILPGNEHTIEILRLNSNPISKIENGAFDNFTALKELDFSMNFHLGLHELFLKYLFPKSLGRLTKLNLARCKIMFINDDAFVNLVSLQILLLYGNPITTFPKAINSLKNLQYLNLDETQITSLLNTGTSLNPKMEKLSMTKSSLKFIDDCALCNYPNLKELRLYQNFNLTFIHENAFGYAYNGTSPPLESFSIEYCKLATIPGDLLNWHNVKKFGLGNNPFMCNCSMAWLINDILSPTHTINLQKVSPHPSMTPPTEVLELEMSEIVMQSMIEMGEHIPGFELPYPSFTIPQPDHPYNDNGLKCFGPHALKHVKFIQISKNFCPNEAKIEKNCKEYSKLVAESSNANFSWLHFGFATVILVIGFVIGISVVPIGRRFCRHRKQDYAFKNFHDDKIPEDFDEEGSTK